MGLPIKKITIEKQKIDRERFFAIGYCPEIDRYLLCVHISWVAGYDRYYVIDQEDIALYEDSQEEFCQKYAREINAYRTSKLIGAGALRNLNKYPPFEGYCYKDEILYANIKIDDSFFTIPPIYDEK